MQDERHHQIERNVRTFQLSLYPDACEDTSNQQLQELKQKGGRNAASTVRTIVLWLFCVPAKVPVAWYGSYAC